MSEVPLYIFQGRPIRDSLPRGDNEIRMRAAAKPMMVRRIPGLFSYLELAGACPPFPSPDVSPLPLAYQVCGVVARGWGVC
jgi:hypothetical protein